MGIEERKTHLIVKMLFASTACLIYTCKMTELFGTGRFLQNTIVLDGNIQQGKISNKMWTIPDRNMAVITVIKQGRLGNNMFQYAALKGMAKLSGRKPILSETVRGLKKIFDLSVEWVTPAVLDRYNFTRYNENLDVRNVNKTIREFLEIGREQNVKLNGFFQSFRFFDSVKTAIRQEFTFKKRVKEAVMRTFKRRFSNLDNVTTVGLHVRLGDMAKYHLERRGFVMPPKTYFQKAMEYFRTKYPNVYFFIRSDNEEKDVLKYLSPHDFDHVFIRKGLRYVDFATLALCDHVIISRGTFSWWAGWLNRGTTIYYKYYNPKNISKSRIPPDEDYIPRDRENHWIPIGH